MCEMQVKWPPCVLAPSPAGVANLCVCIKPSTPGHEKEDEACPSSTTAGQGQDSYLSKEVVRRNSTGGSEDEDSPEMLCPLYGERHKGRHYRCYMQRKALETQAAKEAPRPPLWRVPVVRQPLPVNLEEFNSAEPQYARFVKALWSHARSTIENREGAQDFAESPVGRAPVPQRCGELDGHGWRRDPVHHSWKDRPEAVGRPLSPQMKRQGPSWLVDAEGYAGAHGSKRDLKSKGMSYESRFQLPTLSSLMRAKHAVFVKAKDPKTAITPERSKIMTRKRRNSAPPATRIRPSPSRITVVTDPFEGTASQQPQPNSPKAQCPSMQKLSPSALSPRGSPPLSCASSPVGGSPSNYSRTSPTGKTAEPAKQEGPCSGTPTTSGENKENTTERCNWVLQVKGKGKCEYPESYIRWKRERRRKKERLRRLRAGQIFTSDRPECTCTECESPSMWWDPQLLTEHLHGVRSLGSSPATEDDDTPSVSDLSDSSRSSSSRSSTSSRSSCEMRNVSAQEEDVAPSMLSAPPYAISSIPPSTPLFVSSNSLPSAGVVVGAPTVGLPCLPAYLGHVRPLRRRALSAKSSRTWDGSHQQPSLLCCAPQRPQAVTNPVISQRGALNCTPTFFAPPILPMQQQQTSLQQHVPPMHLLLPQMPPAPPIALLQATFVGQQQQQQPLDPQQQPHRRQQEERHEMRRHQRQRKMTDTHGDSCARQRHASTEEKNPDVSSRINQQKGTSGLRCSSAPLATSPPPTGSGNTGSLESRSSVARIHSPSELPASYVECPRGSQPMKGSQTLSGPTTLRHSPGFVHGAPQLVQQPFHTLSGMPYGSSPGNNQTLQMPLARAQRFSAWTQSTLQQVQNVSLPKVNGDFPWIVPLVGGTPLQPVLSQGFVPEAQVPFVLGGQGCVSCLPVTDPGAVGKTLLVSQLPGPVLVQQQTMGPLKQQFVTLQQGPLIAQQQQRPLLGQQQQLQQPLVVRQQLPVVAPEAQVQPVVLQQPQWICLKAEQPLPTGVQLQQQPFLMQPQQQEQPHPLQQSWPQQKQRPTVVVQGPPTIILQQQEKPHQPPTIQEKPKTHWLWNCGIHVGARCGSRHSSNKTGATTEKNSGQNRGAKQQMQQTHTKPAPPHNGSSPRATGPVNRLTSSGETAESTTAAVAAAVPRSPRQPSPNEKAPSRTTENTLQPPQQHLQPPQQRQGEPVPPNRHPQTAPNSKCVVITTQTGQQQQLPYQRQQLQQQQQQVQPQLLQVPSYVYCRSPRDEHHGTLTSQSKHGPPYKYLPCTYVSPKRNILCGTGRTAFSKGNRAAAAARAVQQEQGSSCCGAGGAALNAGVSCSL